MIAIAFAMLAGCAAPPRGGLRPADYLSAHGAIRAPAPERFSFCIDHGCARVIPAKLEAAQWKDVVKPLDLPAPDAKAERQAVAAAVGRFERVVRARLGVGPDRAGTYPGAFDADQNDCVDETSNTTTLLLMLAADGRLRLHDVGPPAARGSFLDAAHPHRSATLVEHGTGARFVVDSWFRPSGVAADVAPLERWQAGWTPDGGARS
mgnify:CR=1 FL=1